VSTTKVRVIKIDQATFLGSNRSQHVSDIERVLGAGALDVDIATGDGGG
jgi:hypothetical protein